jgi:hypothetical protein
MRPHSKRLTHGALLLGAAACAASPKPDEIDIDFEFECGELDFYDLMVLVTEHRVYEFACGPMPAGYPDLDLGWEDLADEYRTGGRRQCWADPMDDETWRTELQPGCGKETAVNLSIHAFRAASCPTYELLERGGPGGLLFTPSDAFYVGRPRIASFLSASLYDACYYSEPVD